MATFRRRQVWNEKLPWGRYPLKGLLGDADSSITPTNFDSRGEGPHLVPRRKRYHSPLKERPWCPACGVHAWVVVIGDDQYRDPFLTCSGCKETYRMDMTPLDRTYAYRDDILMPDEVRLKYVR